MKPPKINQKLNSLDFLFKIYKLSISSVLLILLINITLTAQAVIDTIIQPGLFPTGIAVYETGNKVFVADTSDKIFMYDGVTHALLDTIHTGIIGINEMVVVEKFGKLYAASSAGMYETLIAVIDANTGDLINHINSGWVHRLEKDEELNRVYVLPSGDLFQIDVEKDTITEIPGLRGTYLSSFGVNPITHEIFYKWGMGPPLVVIDAFSYNHFEVSDIGYGIGIGVNWKENKVYVAYTGGGPSYIYNRNTGTVSETSTSNDASSIIYNPTGNRMYSTREIDGFITVIEGATDSSLNILLEGYYPSVCYATNHVFYSGHIITVIDDSTLSSRTIDVSGSLLAINQLTNRVYATTCDTIKVIQDQNDPWPLTRPELLMPINGQKEIHLGDTLRWKATPRAISYNVEASRYPTFGDCEVQESGITDTVLPIKIYFENTVYYWRVKAINSECSGGWSEKWHFTTIGPIPDVPYLWLPYNNALNQELTLTLEWMDSYTAESYTLQVSTNSDFSTTILNESGITFTSKEINGLDYGTTYYWRVNATNVEGTSYWSKTRNFTTIPAIPDIPILLSPSDSAANQALTLTLNWNTSDRAENYTLQISTISDFSTTILNESGITFTSKEINGLDYGITYYWRVNATNVEGTSYWSETRNFTTLSFVNINELIDNEQIIFYPNPSDNILCIKGIENELTNISITSLDGKLLEQLTGQGIKEINLDNLQKGIYLIKIVNSKKMITKKIIKQ
ncbi:MAG: T9SS type A sorting domain-containing protein [Bacteroidota bacterium]